MLGGAISAPERKGDKMKRLLSLQVSRKLTWGEITSYVLKLNGELHQIIITEKDTWFYYWWKEPQSFDTEYYCYDKEGA
jgi:hypothetical protein